EATSVPGAAGLAASALRPTSPAGSGSPNPHAAMLTTATSAHLVSFIVPLHLSSASGAASLSSPSGAASIARRRPHGALELQEGRNHHSLSLACASREQ